MSSDTQGEGGCKGTDDLPDGDQAAGGRILDLEKVSGSLSIAYGETGDRRAKGTTRLRGGVFVVIPEIS